MAKDMGMYNLRKGYCSLCRDNCKGMDIHIDNSMKAHIDTGWSSSCLSDRDSNMGKKNIDMASRMNTDI